MGCMREGAKAGGGDIWCLGWEAARSVWEQQGAGGGVFWGSAVLRGICESLHCGAGHHSRIPPGMLMHQARGKSTHPHVLVPFTALSKALINKA